MKEILSLVLVILVNYQVQAQTPLFELLPSAQTGVDFNNIVTDEKDHNILIYSNYYGGGGVGVGDFNKDGLPDLFFAGNLVSDELYINQGDLKFEKKTQQAGIEDNGGWSSGVLIADVNLDGWDDIYVTRELYDENAALRRNVLYINQQDGTFKESAAAYGIDDDGRTRHATFLDFDKDGDLDLFLLNQPPNPGNYSPMFGEDLKKQEYAMRLYQNLGDRFQDVSAAAGVNIAAYPNSVSASDLNNDGWTDLYIANDYEARDFLFINQKDGTFKEEIQSATRHISFYSMGVDVADINNDGWFEVMVLDMVAEDNFRLKANMSGMNPRSFWKVVEDGGHYQYMFNTLHYNQGTNADGDLILSDIAQMAGMPSTDWSWCNLFADFDNDGFKDMYVTNGLLRDIRNTDASKTFPKYVQKTIDKFLKENPNAGDVSIWDILDLDEAMKLIPSQELQNYAFKNNGDLTFSKKMEAWGLDEISFSNGAAYADLDLDGDLDLVVNNINKTAFVYENHLEQQKAQHYLRIALEDSKDSRTLLGARLKIEYANGKEQWHELTNVRGMYSSSEQTAHFGLGTATKVDALQVFWPDGKVSTLKNISADQLLRVDYQKAKKSAPKNEAMEYAFFEATDIEVAYKHEENNFDDFAKQVLLPHQMSAFGPAMAKGDINGDGLEDLFLGGAVGQAASIFIQQSSGGFIKSNTSNFTADKMMEDQDAIFFDADNDNDLDLYIVSGGNEFPQQNKLYQDRLYFNDGQGTFTRMTDALPKFKDSGACVRPFDFDKDGDLDLFIGSRHVPWDYPSPAISRLLRNDGGTFSDITKTNARDLIFLGMVTDATWMDFDNDGQEDLVVVGEWMAPTVLKNEQGTFQKLDTNLGAETGWYFSVHAADMDQDGDQDLILGNLGLNYKYKASKQEPFEVHYTDFDKNGSKDIVLSYYNFGKQYPLRGRSCSSEQVPALKKKFESYDLFAGATLNKVYGEEELDNALHYEANNFASLYLENQGNARFKVQVLPNAAQLSSINDIVTTDLNQDGHLDMVLAGNLFVSEIETTRNDAGVGICLLGDGTGAFTPISAQQSGLYLPYDLKQLTLLRGAKGALLVGAVNNGPLQFHRVINQNGNVKGGKSTDSGK